MEPALYLTKVEIQLFKKLPAKVRAAWDKRVEEETYDAFETPQEILRRLHTVDYSKVKGMEKFLQNADKHFESGGDISTLPFDQIPDAAIPTMFHSIGASGMTAMIGAGLQVKDVNDDDLHGIAAMSAMRRVVLMSNSVMLTK
ncbi:MAG: hypothetical protein HOO67_02785 [Candidatus Peribacteraceae bacterium]|nr:hypothetical protein [Candidatus Peribacteraceae bacterium]